MVDRQSLLAFVFFLALGPQAEAQGIDFSVQPLRDVPGAMFVNYIRITPTNKVLVLAFDGQQSFFVTAAGQPWLRGTGALRGSLAHKQLVNGVIVLGLSYVLGDNVYYDAVPDFPTVSVYVQKIENGAAGFLCTDARSFTVSNGDPLASFRGAFPSADGTFYFTGVRTGATPTSGVYSSHEKMCQFTEVFKTDPAFQILQVWKETSGSFLAERAPVNPTILETEIVRYASTGTVTVLFSSTPANKPQTLTATGCCTLVADPSNGNAVVAYKAIDGKDHAVLLAGETTKEVHLREPSGALEPVSIKGDFALILGSQKNPNDTLYLANTATGQFAVIVDAQTVPAGTAAQALGFFKVDLDANGNTYFILTDTSGPKVFQATIKQTAIVPPPAVPSFTAQSVTNAAGPRVGIAVGTLQSLYGSNLLGLADKKAFIVNESPVIPTTLGGTRVLLNGQPLPVTFASDAQVNFIMPNDINDGTIVQLQVTAKDPSSTASTMLISEKVELVVKKSLPYFFMSGGLVIAQNPFTGEVATIEKPLNAYAVDGKLYITFYLTGLGRVLPASVEGLQPLPADTIARTLLTVSGLPAGGAIAYMGATPGFPGLYQLNVVLDNRSIQTDAKGNHKLSINLYFDGDPKPVMDAPFEVYIANPKSTETFR